MELAEIINDVTSSLVAIDGSGVSFKSFKPGVGPYGKPQLLKLIANYLNGLPQYKGGVLTKKSPDLLIPKEWAVEFKIARPYGDNGELAENWSVNLLHPYPGNISTIGDCYKLCGLKCPERLAVTVIGYEHNPPLTPLSPLIKSFEVIAKQVAGIELSERIETQHYGLIHPVHQQLKVFAWQVISCGTLS
jgi:hypothetical protein